MLVQAKRKASAGGCCGQGQLCWHPHSADDRQARYMLRRASICSLRTWYSRGGSQPRLAIVSFLFIWDCFCFYFDWRLTPCILTDGEGYLQATATATACTKVGSYNVCCCRMAAYPQMHINKQCTAQYADDCTAMLQRCDEAHVVALQRAIYIFWQA